MVKLVPLRNVGAGFFFFGFSHAGLGILNPSSPECTDLALDLASMLAPVLLPLYLFVHVMFHTGNPVAEWSVVHTSEHTCTVHLDLVGGAQDVDVAKLSLIAPSHLHGLTVTSQTSATPSDQWKRNNTWNWMWNDVMPPMTLDFDLTWELSLIHI